MAISNQIIVIGNLTSDPELQFTQNGLAYAKFTIASTERKWNAETKQSEDGDASFFRVTLWRDMAENAAASLSKGSRVVAVGVMKQRDYETKEGEKRSAWELDVEEVGPSLRWAKTTIIKQQGNRNQQQNQQQWSQQQGGSQDPWAQTAGQGGWAATASDEAPF